MRKIVASGLTAGLLALFAAGGAEAKGPRGRLPRAGLEGAPGVRVRAEVEAGFGAPEGSRSRARAEALSVLEAEFGAAAVLWDEGTGAPLSIFGRGAAAPGAASDPEVAAAHARGFLERHVALLAPGVLPGDFELVANDLDRGLRTLAFRQTRRAPWGARLPVTSASLSFRYRGDRLVALSSRAMPSEVFLRETAREAPDAASRLRAEARALSWIGEAHARAEVERGEEDEALAYRPLVPQRGSGEGPTAPLAHRVRIRASAPPGLYDVWVDVGSGRLLVRDGVLRAGAAEVRLDVPVRGPEGERQAAPAAEARALVAGVETLTDAAGAISWEGEGPAPLALSLRGPRVEVRNLAGASATLARDAVADGEAVLFGAKDDEATDAQIAAFFHTGVAKDRALAIAPENGWAHQRTLVRVNRGDIACNAFFDGLSINFAAASFGCANTGRLADVVYHEFGHGFHYAAVLEGTGEYDPSLGEGASDYFAATLTGDPEIAPGFFEGGGGPLRRIDEGRVWPDALDPDPHETGLIFAGAMWDLRRELALELGEGPGVALADALFYQVLRRASSIPGAYAELVAADDDDGDLSNGTPHFCAIQRALAAHGLAPAIDPSGLVVEHEPLTILPPREPGARGYPVRASRRRAGPDCGPLPEAELSLRWRKAGGLFGEVPFLPDPEAPGEAGASHFVAEIPPQPQGTALDYVITARVGDASVSLPRNPADPAYRAFVGEGVPIYCTGFEDGGAAWTFGGVGSDFAVGPPLGVAGDPASAFEGSAVLGTDLGEGSDGRYRPGRSSVAKSPLIDLSVAAPPPGARQILRLNFRRWLTVTDGSFDEAEIRVNGEVVWRNEGSHSESPVLHHIDDAWRFASVDVTAPLAFADAAEIELSLRSDPYIEMGGWNVDDLCLVAYFVDPPEAPPPAGEGGEGGEGGGEEAPKAGSGAEPGGCACASAGASDSGTGGGIALLVAVLALASLGGRRARYARRGATRWKSG